MKLSFGSILFSVLFLSSIACDPDRDSANLTQKELRADPRGILVLMRNYFMQQDENSQKMSEVVGWKLLDEYKRHTPGNGLELLIRTTEKSTDYSSDDDVLCMHLPLPSIPSATFEDVENFERRDYIACKYLLKLKQKTISKVLELETICLLNKPSPYNFFHRVPAEGEVSLYDIEACQLTRVLSLSR